MGVENFVGVKLEKMTSVVILIWLELGAGGVGGG